MERDRIVAAGRESDIGVLDGPVARFHILDGTIVPGLIDGHTHLTCSASDRMVADAFEDDDLTATIRATDHAHAALRAGITTLRDCGSRHRVVNRLREAIRLGITKGPRLLLSGSVITTTGGHMYFVGREVDDPLELPRAVREQVRAGADFIKVTNTGGGLVPGNGTAYLQFDRKALRLIIDEATQLGVHVAVHSLSTDGIAEVVEARPRTVEHLTFHKNSDEEIAYDGGLVDRLVERGLPGCQVIVGWHRRAHAALGRLRDDVEPATLQRLENRIKVLQDMRSRGLQFIAGSDAGMPRTWFDNFGPHPRFVGTAHRNEPRPVAPLRHPRRRARLRAGRSRRAHPRPSRGRERPPRRSLCRFRGLLRVRADDGGRARCCGSRGSRGMTGRPVRTVHVGLQHWSRDYDSSLPAAARVSPGTEVTVDLHCCSKGAVAA